MHLLQGEHPDALQDGVISHCRLLLLVHQNAVSQDVDSGPGHLWALQGLNSSALFTARVTHGTPSPL
jgi:hypothetical protein